MTDQPASANFGFLKAHDAQLVRLGALAERYFRDDPNTCLLKLRQFGEVLAQLVAARAGLFENAQEPQADLLRRLKLERVLPPDAADLFHHIRLAGNKASHANTGGHAEALTGLKVARELGVWFHRTFGPQKKFSPGTFVPPPNPADATKALSDELRRLRDELDKHRTAAVSFRQACTRGCADLFLGGIVRQKSPHRGAADLQAAGDLGLADPCAMQFPDLSSVDGGSRRSAEPLAILAGMRQASPRSFPQNLPFELGEDSQQASHGPTGRRGQILRLATIFGPLRRFILAHPNPLIVGAAFSGSFLIHVSS